MKHIIAIDGPAGSGKGVTARRLAKRFGFMYLDSGMLYRAFACMEVILSDKVFINNDVCDCATNEHKKNDNHSYCRLRNDLSDFCDEVGFFQSLSNIFQNKKSTDGVTSLSDYLNGDFLELGASFSAKDIISAIKYIPEQVLRSEIIGIEASTLAKLPKVRDVINKIMRNFVSSMEDNLSGIVLDGRDIGTVVFPQATCKIFLTADPKIRAQRRFKDIESNNSNVNFDEVYANICARDEQDYYREVDPLVCGDDYVIIDNSYDTIDETVEKIAKIVDNAIKSHD